MSNIVQGLVWKAEFPNPIAKLIAVKLADWADDDGESIYPKIATVATMTGCGRATVCKWLHALEACGLLEVRRRGGGAENDSTRRAFNVELLRRLASPNRQSNPELKLVVDVVEHQAKDRKTGEPLVNADGSAKVVRATVFRVEPYAPGEGANDNAQPIHHVDGSTDRTRPRRGCHPSTSRAPTRPPRGPITIRGESVSRTIPPTPKGGGNDVRVAFKDGKLELYGELLAEWLQAFEGDAKGLELALVGIAGRLRANSRQPLEQRVTSKLAETVSKKRDQDRRYAAATAANAKRGPTRAKLTRWVA